MDELRQVLLSKQVEAERDAAGELVRQKKYIQACPHLMSLSSIFRKAAYIYPPEHANNLFTLSSGFETLALSMRDKGKTDDLGKLVKMNEAGLADVLFFPERTQETFDHVGGLEDAKMKIRKHGDSTRTFLLYGPAGSGKRMLARAFAHYRNVDFYELNASLLFLKYFGDARRIIDAVFDKALRSAGAVIFLEGMDVFSKERTSFKDTKSILLYLMAKAEEVQRYGDLDIFVIASAIEPWKLDTDVPDHMVGKVYLPLPDEVSRAIIFKLCLAGTDSAGLDMGQLVAKTRGFTGKQISDACYGVLEKMLLEQNPGLEQLNVRTMERDLAQRPLTTDEFAPFLEKTEPPVVAEESYRLWKNEYDG